MLVEEYLMWKESYAPRAAEAYKLWVKRFQAYANKAPEEFLLTDWTGFKATLKGRYSPKSQQFAMTVIHNYLRYWQEQGRLGKFRLFLAKVKPVSAHTHNTASEEEYRAMVDVLRRRGKRSLRDLALLMLLHDTGMRVGEVVQLEIDGINEDASAIIRTEKTIHRRCVFWNADTDQVVNQWIVERVNGGAESDWLFVSDKVCPERRLLTRNVQRMVRKVAKEAGIKRKISPHSFRHAFIHRLAKLGVPDAMIAEVV